MHSDQYKNNTISEQELIRHFGRHMYLVAIIDVYSLYIVGWSLSPPVGVASVLKRL